MECLTNFSLRNTSVYIPLLRHEDHMEIVKQYSTAATTIFATIVAILMLFKRSVKKCTNNNEDNIRKNTETFIQAVSLFEIIIAIKRHKYGLLPGFGSILKKYNGAFRFKLGIYKIMMVSRPSILEKLTSSSNIGHLHKPKSYNKLAFKFIRDTLFTLRAEPWKVHRSVLARAFTYNSLQEQVKIFEEHAKKLAFAIDQSLPQKKSENNECSKLDLGKAVSSHVLYIILHIATGRSIVGNHVETARFCYLIEKIRILTLCRLVRPMLLLDLVWYFHPRRWELERINTEIKLMFKKALKTAREEVDIDDNLEEDMAGKSLIHLMIKAGFKDEEIFQELFMFIVVSNEGVPTNIKMLLFHLALNPDIQEKCQKEIGEMFEKLNGNANAEMNIELLSELAYLEQCIMETIRLYPGVIAPGRMLESPLVLDDQSTIAADTRVFMSAFHIHRDPKYYPNPEKFDPERFSPEKKKERGKCEFIGFSKGPRDCIGKKSAVLEIKVLLAYILYNFEAYTNNTREKFEMEMGPNRWPIPDPKVELRRRL